MIKNNFSSDYKKSILDKVSDQYKQEIENYIDVLQEKKVPIIFDRIHLYSYLTQIEMSPLDFYNISENNKKIQYSSKIIEKKNKKEREILIPSNKLKMIQKWILVNILEQQKVHSCGHGFVINKSIKTNAALHVNQRVVFSIDVENFFDSITFDKVLKIFKNIGYFDEVAEILAELCTYDNKLPQGAPTSPYLSNIFLYDCDNEIFEYCISNNLNYSRYADDITISGDSIRVDKVLKSITIMLKKYNLKLNAAKTRCAYNWERQIVTGVLVNDRLNLSKSYRNELRQDIYYLEKYGLDNHLEKKYSNSELFFSSNYKNHMYGKVYFFKMFDEKKALKYLSILNEIDWK